LNMKKRFFYIKPTTALTGILLCFIFSQGCKEGCSSSRQQSGPAAAVPAASPTPSSAAAGLVPATPETSAAAKASSEPALTIEGKWSSPPEACTPRGSFGRSEQTYIFKEGTVTHQLTDFSYPGCTRLIRATRMVGSYTIGPRLDHALQDGIERKDAYVLDITWRQIYLTTTDAEFIDSLRNSDQFAARCTDALARGKEVSMNECAPEVTPEQTAQYSSVLRVGNQLFIGSQDVAGQRDGSRAEKRLIDLTSAHRGFILQTSPKAK
jgi:hypothetical protein